MQKTGVPIPEPEHGFAPDSARRPLWLGAIDAAIYVTLTLAIALALERFVGTLHVRLVFLVPVMIAAVRDGWFAAVLATGLSIFAVGKFVSDEPWPPALTPTDAGPYVLFAAVAAIAMVAIVRTRTRPQTRNTPAAVPVQTNAEAFRLAMLSSLSHDFKAPLASILGAISSLRHYGGLYDDRTRDEMLATAQSEIERLNRYFSNLLDITRLDTGTLDRKMEAIDVADVIGTALKRAEPVTRNHRVETDVQNDLPMVPLDFSLTEQALYNLIDNAAKYAPEGTAIAVCAATSETEIEITVTDRGPGIPPAHLEKVFDRFYRVPSQVPCPGVGLGLSVAKGFVESMGGTLVAENNRDGGAVFRIRLPLHRS